jgi:hypothetical protein
MTRVLSVAATPPGGGTLTAEWWAPGSRDPAPPATGVLRLDRLSVWLLVYAAPREAEAVSAAAPDLADALDRLLTRLPSSIDAAALAAALLDAVAAAR